MDLSPNIQSIYTVINPVLMNRRHWSLDITVSVLEFRSLCSDTNPTTTACRHDTHFMLSLIKLSMSLIQKACSSPPCNTQKCWIISSAQREQGRRWRTRVALGPSADNVEGQRVNYSGWCWATASIRLSGERCSINAFKHTALSHLFMNDCINNPFCLGNEWVILGCIFFVQNIISFDFNVRNDQGRAIPGKHLWDLPY